MCRPCPVCWIFMQFSKGIICRKLSRKYEFHESRLSDSCTSGHKWIFSCKFHFLAEYGDICYRISPCNSIQQLQVLCIQWTWYCTWGHKLNLAFTFYIFRLVLIKCGTEDPLAITLSNYEVPENWHSEWNILWKGKNETLPVFFTSSIYMSVIPENQCLSSIHCKVHEAWRTV